MILFPVFLLASVAAAATGVIFKPGAWMPSSLVQRIRIRQNAFWFGMGQLSPLGVVLSGYRQRGKLPHFLNEQRPVPSPRQAEARARAAQEARGEAAWDKLQKGGQLGTDEFADMCRFIDPTSRAEPPRKRYR